MGIFTRPTNHGANLHQEFETFVNDHERRLEAFLSDHERRAIERVETVEERLASLEEEHQLLRGLQRRIKELYLR